MIVADYELLEKMQRRIEQLPNKEKTLLKNIRFCGRAPIPAGQLSGVFLVAGEKKARFVGLTTCDSVWTCPVCSVKIMNKHREKMQLALNNLNEKAAMLTFTIPHLKFMPLSVLIDSLFTAWYKFTKSKTSAFGTIKNSDFGTKFYARAMEITYGESGWHPHFHLLLWVKDLQKLGEREEHLRAKWKEISCAVLAEKLSEYFKKPADYYVKTLNDIAENNDVSKPLYISRNDDGKVRSILSSDYICGWGGDSELTASHEKKARDGHMTMNELFSAAITDDESLKLYCELTVATRRRCRVNLSRALLAKIKLFQQSVKYFEEIAKKKESAKVVCWFTREQWSEICSHDCMRANILYLAKHELFAELKALLSAFDWLNDFPHPCQSAYENLRRHSSFEEVA